MYDNFFKFIDIIPENVHILDGNAEDLEAECLKYEQLIEKYGGIELFLGGIGPDGHIAFNEPDPHFPPELESRRWLTTRFEPTLDFSITTSPKFPRWRSPWVWVR